MPGDHPDRVKWNARYAAGFAPSFTPHPLAVRVFESATDLPDGPVADLACGASGTPLLAAAHGRRVTALDVSGCPIVGQREQGDHLRARGGHVSDPAQHLAHVRLADRVALIGFPGVGTEDPDGLGQGIENRWSGDVLHHVLPPALRVVVPGRSGQLADGIVDRLCG